MKYLSSHSLLSMVAVPLLFGCCAACNKLVETSPSGGSLTGKELFSNDRDAEAYMKGLYFNMMNNDRGLFNGGLTLYAGLTADELYRTTSFPQEDEFFTNTLSDKNPKCNDLYIKAYARIYHCNDVIEKVVDPSISKVSKGMQARLLAEARFNRGFIYFLLVNLYGDVPLSNSTPYNVNNTLPRAPAQEVYELMAADLEGARQGLPATYPSSEYAGNVRTRPTRAVATALLARVSLYRGDWKNAEQLATLLIDDSTYQLEPDLDRVFLSTSRETIWALHPVYGNWGTAEAQQFIPAAGMRPTYALTSWLLSSFEARDLRLPHWTGQVRDGILYTYPAKYKAMSSDDDQAEDNVILRLSEQYLIRAEARAQQGDSAGALEDLNVIRRRAGLPDLSLPYTDGLLSAIYHEWQVEFFAEWGHRWLDLRRTGLIDVVLGKEKSGWRHDAALFPLPHDDLVRDPNLRQNPGY